MTGLSALESAWRALAAEDRVVALLQAAAGTPALLVGGALRDAGLGRPVNDLDVVVADEGAAIAARLAEATGARLVALGGDRFGALRLVSGSRQIDLWDLQGGSLTTDLWRRDFSVNAIALTLPDAAIVDPTGGVADLLQRRLRATREAVFVEDPVRVLRLARLATTLSGFSVDPATADWARSATHRLAEMPHERLRTELETLFSQAALAPAARWFDELDLGALFFGKGAAVPSAVPSTLPIAEALDRWREHQAETWRAAGEPSASAPDALLALHWALFTELLAASRIATAQRLRGLRQAGLMTRACSEAALRLLAAAWEPPTQEVPRRVWLHAAGPGWREAVALRAALASSETVRAAWRELERALLAWPAGVREGVLSPAALLSGDEVQRLLGIGPGPAVGKALARVRSAQVEGAVSVREEAEALLLARSLPD